MGEGEGRKDVSDQIENEEQLLGLKDNKLPDEGQQEAKKEHKQLEEVSRVLGCYCWQFYLANSNLDPNNRCRLVS